jgi:hypothetical protein
MTVRSSETCIMMCACMREPWFASAERMVSRSRVATASRSAKSSEKNLGAQHEAPAVLLELAAENPLPDRELVLDAGPRAA